MPDRGSRTTQRRDAMIDYYVVPFIEPSGATTWAVQEIEYRPDYYRRQLVSFHIERNHAEDARRERYRKRVHNA